jgi:hypothetical protein
MAFYLTRKKWLMPCMALIAAFANFLEARFSVQILKPTDLF